MKKAVLFLLLSIFVTSCYQNNTKYTLEVSYVDGYTDTISWILPENSKFSINSNKGSYSLCYYYGNGIYTINHLKHGIIRYKVLSSHKVNKENYGTQFRETK